MGHDETVNKILETRSATSREDNLDDYRAFRMPERVSRPDTGSFSNVKDDSSPLDIEFGELSPSPVLGTEPIGISARLPPRFLVDVFHLNLTSMFQGKRELESRPFSDLCRLLA